MDLTSQQYGFDVKIIIILMLNLYGNDIVTVLSFRYGFDIISIWIRCRYDIYMMSNPYHCDIVMTLSLPYGFDIESISLRCRIHIVAISNPYRNDNAIAISLPYGFDIEMIMILTSNPYRCDVESILKR